MMSRRWIAFAVYLIVFLALFVSFSNISMFGTLERDLGPLVSTIIAFSIVVGLANWQQQIRPKVQWVIEFLYLNQNKTRQKKPWVRIFVRIVIVGVLVLELVIAGLIANCVLERRGYVGQLNQLTQIFDKDPLDRRIGELTAELILRFPTRVDAPLLLARKSASLNKLADPSDKEENDKYRQFNSVAIEKLLSETNGGFSFSQEDLEVPFLRQICLCNEWASEHDVIPWLVVFTMESRRTAKLSGISGAKRLIAGFVDAPTRKLFALLFDLHESYGRLKVLAPQSEATALSDPAINTLRSIDAIELDLRELIANGQGKRAVVTDFVYEMALDQLAQGQLYRCSLAERRVELGAPVQSFIDQAIRDFQAIVNNRLANRVYDSVYLARPEKLVLYAYMRFLSGQKDWVKDWLLNYVEETMTECTGLRSALINAFPEDMRAFAEDIRKESFWTKNTITALNPPDASGVKDWLSWIDKQAWRW